MTGIIFVASINTNIDPEMYPSIIKTSDISGKCAGKELVGNACLETFGSPIPGTEYAATYSLILSRKVPIITPTAINGGPQKLRLTGFQIIIKRGKTKFNINTPIINLGQ